MGAGQQLLGCPALASYGTAACSLANSALSWRASALRLSLDPLTPPLRSARRDTGFPAVASLRATKDAWTPPWSGELETTRLAAPGGVAEPGESVEPLVLGDGLVRTVILVPA